MERLTVKQLDGTYHIYDNKVIRKASCCDENNKNWFSLYEGKAIDRLGEYEDLEEKGLLLKLPCELGGEVWRIATQQDNYDDYEYKIAMRTSFRLDMLNCIGKTIFLTKEEAEQKIAQLKNR